MMKYYKFLVIFLFLFSSILLAQNYTISGTVESTKTGEKLIGADVYLMGADIGAATDVNGKYKITAPGGTYQVICSYIGYQTKKVELHLKKDTELNFSLEDHQFVLNVTVLADRATENETPVAFSNIEKKGLELRLGSRDIPMVLNTTPSVYATEQGGGDGDARINVRGFNQRDVAIMFNGVPVNDMENGWLYWSDWSGVGDATSSIQLQRGLSAVNLAVPSIGGTINIITDPTSQKAGFSYKQEFGSGGFLKSTFSASTGLLDKKFALNAEVVRKTGNGVIDKTWTDAWVYYFGATYNINKNNRIELYALGGPQVHGQNLYAQNIAAYSHSYAKKLGYTDAQLAQFPERSRYYNENWNGVDPSYIGQQFWDGSLHSRYSPNFIGERVNYYNKPIVDLNYFTDLSDRVSWYSTVYYSGGNGGGSGTLGSMKWDYSGPSRIVDWNATIANNLAHGDTSQGILRNSVNNQWTVGAISKAYFKISDEVKTSVGIDWRTASIDHFQEVRDLLGGKYYYYNGNQFDSPANYLKGLGDKVGYYNTNTVNWFGFYGQAQYVTKKITAYGTYGWSTIRYTYKDHFHKDASGNELYLKSKNIPGFQIKGGASYRLNNTTDFYANLGYVSLVPIFDDVIDDVTGTLNSNTKNQKYTSVEAGFNYHLLSGKLNLKADYYYTIWDNQASKINVYPQSGGTDVIFLTGINSLHTGLELDGAYQPIGFCRFDATVSLGNWKYLDDVNGVYKTYSNTTITQTDYHFYVKNLKVGDAPQTQFTIQASVFPVEHMEAQVIYRNYTNYYANWDPFSRTNVNDQGQVWKAPGYGIFDADLQYQLPIELNNVKVDLYAHLFNIFDAIYVQDATDDSQYNGVKGAPSHSAQRAEVFLGMPRTVNVGVSLNY